MQSFGTKALKARANEQLQERVERLERNTAFLKEELDRSKKKLIETTYQFSDLRNSVAVALRRAADCIEGAVGFTKQEIARMSADEYKEKILIPLRIVSKPAPNWEQTDL